jgi:hypothetical protein
MADSSEPPSGVAEAARIAGVEIQELPAKHFLQEDHAPQIAERVAAFVRG